MERYWVYIDSKVQGPVEVAALRKVAGFTLLTQVCSEAEQTWRIADDIIEIKSYFLAPPRASSLPREAGNLALKAEPVAQSEPESSLERAVTAPALIETLPDSVLRPPIALNRQVPQPEPALETLKDPATALPLGVAPLGALRLVCAVCGYKNPRDVASCMKCGGALETPAAAIPSRLPPSVSPTLKGELPALVKPPLAIPTVGTPSAPSPLSLAAKAEPSMVEIPISKILFGLLAAAAIVGGGWEAKRLWKNHRGHKVAPVSVTVPAAASARAHVVTRRRKHVTHPIYRPRPTALPGVSDETAPAENTPRETPAVTPAPASAESPTAPEASEKPVTYHVLPEAAPLKKRQHAPLNSVYAQKRRADHGLWSGQEEQAIRQVQALRIYGGQRTVLRNVEILMQILRDREYTAAFETGKRLHYYDDMDWVAAPKSGPSYEVELTFAGGKEVDGTARKPLKFAFDADLERGTVDPTGPEATRSNTMHAFFDESRIAPDDRRAIAKDTEELILGAQPEASPLALETIAHHFVGTYGSDALKRVADAYGLDLVKKKLVHDPTLAEGRRAPKVSDNTVAPVDAIFPKSTAVRVTSAAPNAERGRAESPKKMTSKKSEHLTSSSGPIDFQIESGKGRERNITLRVPTKATTSQLWETLTGYDNFQQFVPDMLQSQREGQDGGAVIIHTVSLTRFWFFVFKVNLHLRVIEHPLEHTLEFERIAGEFENFRGSVQIRTEEGARSPTLTFRATVVPKGHMPDYVFRGMCSHLLVNALDAIRAHAEAQP